jgi:hypothetical protein
VSRHGHSGQPEPSRWPPRPTARQGGVERSLRRSRWPAGGLVGPCRRRGPTPPGLAPGPPGAAGPVTRLRGAWANPAGVTRAVPPPGPGPGPEPVTVTAQAHNE